MSGKEKRVFFSYAREDAEFALRLATDLRNHGLSIWLDQLDIRPGERWDRAVEQALESSATFLVILSPDAVDSANVMDEVSYALEERKTTIPVLYRSCKLPFRLRRLQHIDFTSDYDDGLARLVTALTGKVQVLPQTPEIGPEAPAAQRTDVPERASRHPRSEERAAPKEAPPAPAATGSLSRTTRPLPRRKAAAMLGALIGAIYGGLAAFLIYLDDQRMNTLARLLEPVAAYAGVAAVAGAIAGAIAGWSPKVLLPIAAAVLAVSVAWVAIWGTYADVVATGMVLGGGVTAIIAAGIWALMRRRSGR